MIHDDLLLHVVDAFAPRIEGSCHQTAQSRISRAAEQVA
jgi:hypothetical protein